VYSISQKPSKWLFCKLPVNDLIGFEFEFEFGDLGFIETVLCDNRFLVVLEDSLGLIVLELS
jgi:hypothetical protein